MSVHDRDEIEGAFERSLWSTALLVAFGLAMGTLVMLVVTSIDNQLRTASLDLAAGAQEISAAATQISLSSQELAQGSVEQAATLEQTSASAEEIDCMTRENADRSLAAADLAGKSENKAEETNRALMEMVKAIGEIGDASGKIAVIIKTIEGIAFQTNILSLNAAVEAARAGEAGMGFAVVAGEVRTLAQRCSQAARDTAALIEHSISKSASGAEKMKQFSGVIQNMTEEFLRVKKLVDEVSSGCGDQANGIHQISKAVSEMQSVTQKTAATAEASASASEKLEAQSQALSRVVEQLTALVGH